MKGGREGGREGGRKEKAGREKDNANTVVHVHCTLYSCHARTHIGQRVQSPDDSQLLSNPVRAVVWRREGNETLPREVTHLGRGREEGREGKEGEGESEGGRQGGRQEGREGGRKGGKRKEKDFFGAGKKHLTSNLSTSIKSSTDGFLSGFPSGVSSSSLSPSSPLASPSPSSAFSVPDPPLLPSDSFSRSDLHTSASISELKRTRKFKKSSPYGLENPNSNQCFMQKIFRGGGGGVDLENICRGSGVVHYSAI